MRSAERRKVNVLEMKCLRSLVGVSRMDGVRNEEVHRRTGIERELASRADQRVLRWFLLLLKPRLSGKGKNVHKLPTQPHKHLHYGKIEKQTQPSNQRVIAPLNPSNVPVSNTVQGRSFHTRVRGLCTWKEWMSAVWPEGC